jgi:hypothetical protein
VGQLGRPAVAKLQQKRGRRKWKVVTNSETAEKAAKTTENRPRTPGVKMTPSSKLAEHGILTRKEVAQSLNVTEETLSGYEKEYGFPGRTMGQTTLYDVEAIRKWIASKPKRA